MNSNQNYFIHPNALVATSHIGDATRIWAFVNIFKDAKIGSNCNICDNCTIENDVVIGNNVTIKTGNYICDGVTIEDYVHIGANVGFTNDVRQRSKKNFKLARTSIKKGASIGTNSVILGGVEIGEYAMAGIGSVITRNVKSYALVYGNPARQHGWVDEEGNKISKKENNIWISNGGNKYKETENGLVKI